MNNIVCVSSLQTHIIQLIVPRAGVEPARPNGHMALNHACLPVPAPGQYAYYNIT